MSERNKADTEIRTTLDAVKNKLKLSNGLLCTNSLYRAIPGVVPQSEEQVRNNSNKVAVEKEVLSKDKCLKVTKFSDTLNLAILDLTKLVHTKFSNSINLSIDNQLVMHFTSLPCT